MKYILLNDDNAVAEIIPEENPDLPGFPVEERYAPDFIAQLLSVEDGVEVEQNWIFDPENKTFSHPAIEENVTEEEPTSDPEDAADTPATVSILDGMTVAQMKEYAANNDIDLGNATKKADIRAAIEVAETRKETV